MNQLSPQQTEQWLQQVAALADPLRNRFLMVLERHELTVGEICETFGLPQSTVSRQLKTLTESDWIVVRRDGTRRLYRMPFRRLPDSARALWSLGRETLTGDPTVDGDLSRAASVQAARRKPSRAFFEKTAERWDRLRDELYGSQIHLAAALTLIEDNPVVGDLGCGSGSLAAAWAPVARQVFAVDDSEAMLQAARKRLARFDNVTVRTGPLEALPIDDGVLDIATLMLVLHHVPDPACVLAETARALKPQGRLVLVDMLPHDRDAFRNEMGHVWMGFSRSQLEQLCQGAGLDLTSFASLESERDATGPPLFVAGARCMRTS